MECLFIFKLGKSTKLVNRRNELYGACKQNPKLHRFNTDDPLGKKVLTEINTNVEIQEQLYTANCNVLENRNSIPVFQTNPLQYCQT